MYPVSQARLVATGSAGAPIALLEGCTVAVAAVQDAR
jgi:hypothetical protein